MASRTLEVEMADGLAAVPAAEKKDLCSITDFSADEIKVVLDLALAMKERPDEFSEALKGKQVVMFFEKPSLRTRLTFEAGLNSLGGTAFFVDQSKEALGAREKLSDIARNLERWVDGVVLRTFSHETVTGMAEHASIPVINGLSDHEHPCQALADFLTLTEKFDDLREVKLAYVGDGNNVANSLLLTAASLGVSMTVACPIGYTPDDHVIATSLQMAAQTGARIEVTHDPEAAVDGAHAVYTDVWASMGQESEAQERKRIFTPFQVNEKLMSAAGPSALFMHCLPAHRGDEVTDAVIDSANSVVFDQAENRLHVQKAIMLKLLGNGSGR